MAKARKPKKTKHVVPEWANRLYALRVVRFASQAEFAALIGATTGQYGNWERGQREPPFPALCRIKEVLQCSLDFMIAGDRSTAPNRDFGGRRTRLQSVSQIGEERREVYRSRTG